MNEVARFLAEHDASGELERFARKYRSLSSLWEECPRADWLLWIVEKLNHRNRRELRLFACWCARSFWSLMEDERSRRAVVISERLARGDATRNDLLNAQYAAVKAAKEATVRGEEVGACYAWVACAVTMYPSIEAAKHVVQRSMTALGKMPASRLSPFRWRSQEDLAERLREQVANPFRCTRADTGYEMRQSAYVPWSG